MNENQIRYFKALYELPNIRAAARSIPLSRQGLLKSLESTERELNSRMRRHPSKPSSSRECRGASASRTARIIP
ncbi:MAG: hypothetical protein E6Y86_07325 [Slackia sp.]|uniref:hypothetical protein n=1 Tax=uncultured Slackia sp. TaxID=665903 RepID=UPI00280479A9|nr:hypothetical protein [uncultured Slackia sp.]MDU6011840.1 hypothetical protein [Slackia sp.]